ncbi:uncharacterized protein BYT42DRAFT_566339 [Radiomyces spectabilis]|uniref:uncharacterized protein n=1 Tax=Radiomyces spectabilis TaxID=64574 RepID=UPI00221F328E|nr:uncharacterized protein BYT42DRAFT_566339 [Radiomyces spectabilis]KAI8381383.1 hypothetical protein BYT42DRAFT_566339 [Radiomyces spectabilis]
MAPIIVKIRGNKPFAPFSQMDSEDDLCKTWRVCTKIRDSLENGSRLENLSWRLWFRNHVSKESAFRRLTKGITTQLERHPSIGSTTQLPPSVIQATAILRAKTTPSTTATTVSRTEDVMVHPAQPPLQFSQPTLDYYTLSQFTSDQANDPPIKMEDIFGALSDMQTYLPPQPSQPPHPSVAQPSQPQTQNNETWHMDYMSNSDVVYTPHQPQSMLSSSVVHTPINDPSSDQMNQTVNYNMSLSMPSSPLLYGHPFSASQPQTPITESEAIYGSSADNLASTSDSIFDTSLYDETDTAQRPYYHPVPMFSSSTASVALFDETQFGNLNMTRRPVYYEESSTPQQPNSSFHDPTMQLDERLSTSTLASPYGDSQLKQAETDLMESQFPQPVCTNCGATSTPLWRRSPDDDLLCNACGLYQKLHNAPRPKSLKSNSTRTSIREEENSQLVCSNCATMKTPLWRRDEEGAPLCNACGLYLKLHHERRPLSMKTDVIRKRQRHEPGGGNGRKILAKKLKLEGKLDAANITTPEPSPSPDAQVMMRQQYFTENDVCGTPMGYTSPFAFP